MGQVTIGSNVIDIFGTATEANLHFKEQLGSTVWDDGDTADKNKALVTATRWLTRIGVVDASGAILLPSLADLGVPDEVKLGSYELALDLLVDPTIIDSTPGSSNQKKVKAGSAEVEFFRPRSGKKLPRVALEYLSPFLASNISSGELGSISSGTDKCSQFDDSDKFGLTQGYS